MTAKAELRRLADENLPEWFERLNEAVNADRTYSQRVACPGCERRLDVTWVAPDLGLRLKAIQLMAEHGIGKPPVAESERRPVEELARRPVEELSGDERRRLLAEVRARLAARDSEEGGVE